MSDLESTMFPHLRFYVQLDRESKSSGYIAQWITMHSGCTHLDLLMHLTHLQWFFATRAMCRR